MNKFKELCNSFIDAMQSKAGFAISVVVFTAILFVLAFLFERYYKRKRPNFVPVANTKKIALIGVFSALAAVLMYFEFPLFFAPDFYKLDLSEIPVLICGFMLGPVSAAFAEVLKILIKCVIKPTSTAFVGEFANFIVGCAFVIPASILYHLKKTRINALISMGIGTLVMTATAMFTNAFILLPAFAAMFHSNIDSFVNQGAAINPAISNLTTLIVLAVTPFNIVKGVLVSIIVFLVYKKISSLLRMKLN